MEPLPFLKELIIQFLSRYQFSNKNYFEKKPVDPFKPINILTKTIESKSGICSELNYTFAFILETFGYETILVKCFKPKYDGTFYDIFHLGIIVLLNDQKYFVDIGFGEHFFEPILLKDDHRTGKILIKSLHSTNNYDLYLSVNQKLLFRIIDKGINLQKLEKNYHKFFNASANDFPLCKVLYERIYDPKTNQYTIPVKKAAL